MQEHNRRAVAHDSRVERRPVDLDESGSVGRGSGRRGFVGRTQASPGGDQRGGCRQHRCKHHLAHEMSAGNLVPAR